MKGIILAGGSGTRLYPLTRAISKQMLPVYDKPMIYYPLSTLMLANIREILIISTPRDTISFKNLLGDGKELGLSISYATQMEPTGVADAFTIGAEFIGNDRVCLILGDNIFYARGFSGLLLKSASFSEGATIFGYHVKNPENFGVVEIDSSNRILSIEEKPQDPKSNYAVPGLYFYDNDVVSIAKQIKPSSRGEKEISAINAYYLEKQKLRVELMGRGMVWLDTGTHEGLFEASNFVCVTQRRQGLYISCIEEIAYRKGYIDKNQLLKLAKPMLKTEYGKYLEEIAQEKRE